MPVFTLTHCGHRAAAPPAHPVGRQGGHSRVSRPSGCRAHRAGTSRGGSRALRKVRGRTVPRTRRPRAHHARSDRCSRLASVGTTAMGGRHGHSSGHGERRWTRRCGWRARSAGGAGAGRRDGRARARGAVLGFAMCWSGRPRAAQVGAVVSGAPGSFGPAPGRSGPVRGWSLAVPRPERASGACLCAARGCSCAKMRVL